MTKTAKETRKRVRKSPRRRGYVTSGTAAMSLSDIGKIFGVTLQSVQQVERRALEKIRAAIEKCAAEEGLTVEQWLRQ